MFLGGIIIKSADATSDTSSPAETAAAPIVILYDQPLVMTAEDACKDGISVQFPNETVSYSADKCKQAYPLIRDDYNKIVAKVKKSKKIQDKSNGVEKKIIPSNKPFITFFLERQAKLAASKIEVAGTVQTPTPQPKEAAQATPQPVTTPTKECASGYIKNNHDNCILKIECEKGSIQDLNSDKGECYNPCTTPGYGLLDGACKSLDGDKPAEETKKEETKPAGGTEKKQDEKPAETGDKMKAGKALHELNLAATTPSELVDSESEKKARGDSSEFYTTVDVSYKHGWCGDNGYCGGLGVHLLVSPGWPHDLKSGDGQDTAWTIGGALEAYFRKYFGISKNTLFDIGIALQLGFSIPTTSVVFPSPGAGKHTLFEGEAGIPLGVSYKVSENEKKKQKTFIRFFVEPMVLFGRAQYEDYGNSIWGMRQTMYGLKVFAVKGGISVNWMAY